MMENNDKINYGYNINYKNFYKKKYWVLKMLHIGRIANFSVPQNHRQLQKLLKDPGFVGIFKMSQTPRITHTASILHYDKLFNLEEKARSIAY